MFYFVALEDKVPFNKNDERNGRKKCKEYVRWYKEWLEKNNHLISFFLQTQDLFQ